MEIGSERAAVGQLPGVGLFSKLFWMISLLPGISLGVFYSFVGRAYWVLGTWPMPYHPDPKDLNFFWHYRAVGLSFPLVLWAALTMIFLVILEPRVYLRGTYKWGLLFFGVTFALWLLLMRLDPGNFVLWFID